MLIRRYLYQKQWLVSSTQLPGIVISIGNLEVGGTGKSPIVISLAENLRASGLKVAIITRGYRSGLGVNDMMVLQSGEVIFKNYDAGNVRPDEAMMQSVALPDIPIIVGRKRIMAVEQFKQRFFPMMSVDVWILDDGFQHLQIKRHIDIVLLNDRNPFDGHFILPSGRLREPYFALNKSQLILSTRANLNAPLHSCLKRMQRKGFFIERVAFAQKCPELTSKKTMANGEQKQIFETKLALIAGIARPNDMLDSLQDAGYRIESTYFVGDHQPFDLIKAKKTLESCDAVITSTKDWARDPNFFERLQSPVYVTTVEPLISEEFFEEVKKIVKKIGKEL